MKTVIDREVLTGKIGMLAAALTSKTMTIIEDDDDSSSLTVRLSTAVKNRIEAYSKLGNVSQGMIARILITDAIDVLDDDILTLQSQREEHEEKLFADFEESEKARIQKQQSALDALKAMRGE